MEKYKQPAAVKLMEKMNKLQLKEMMEHCSLKIQALITINSNTLRLSPYKNKKYRQSI